MRVKVGEVALDLTDDQAADLRRQLGARPSGGELIDAAAVAQRLGVSREYVYDHATELGGQKLGDGPKARWRFDPLAVERHGQLPAGPASPERQTQAKSAGRAGSRRIGALLPIRE